MTDTLQPVRYRDVEETKSAVLAATKVDLPGDQPGTFSAFVNVTNIVDHDNDKILPGAFQATLAQRNPKVFWGHDPNAWIGKTLQAEELMPGDPRLPESIRAVGGGALLVRGQFNLDTQAGREAYSNAKFFGTDVEWSVGFRIPAGAASIDTATQTRVIEKVDLYEYSMVYAGASPGTHTQTIKEQPMKATAALDVTKDEIEDDQLVEFVLEDGTVMRGMFRVVTADLYTTTPTTAGSAAKMSDSDETVTKTDEGDEVDPIAEAYAKGRADAFAEVWLTAEWVQAEVAAWTAAEAEWKAQATAETVETVDDEVLDTADGEPITTTETVDDEDDEAVDTTISADDEAEIEALLLENDIAGGDLL